MHRTDHGVPDIRGLHRSGKNIAPKILAFVAIAMASIMILSFLLVPHEGAASDFIIQRKDGQDRIEYSNDAPGSTVEFELEIASIGDGDSWDHEIVLQIVNITYAGSSSATHWEFDFLDAKTDTNSTYEANHDESTPVTLEVTFLGSKGGEIVSFTIIGLEDGANSTYLANQSTRATDQEFLTVVSATEYIPYWEPQSASDREEHKLPNEDTFGITVMNLGSESDTILVTGWEVWQDLNGDGVIDEGSDTQNDFFSILFEKGSGGEYLLNESIDLSSGDMEELVIRVTPEQDNTKIPPGNYLIKIKVASANGEIVYESVLKIEMAEIALPDFFVNELNLSASEVEDGNDVVIQAEIGIDWDRDGNVSYAFYVDDEVIEDGEGKVFFKNVDVEKTVQVTWKAKAASDNDYRKIIFKLDPDDIIKERYENNNEESRDIKVIEEEKEEGFLRGSTLVVIIGGAIIAGGAFWFFLIAWFRGDLEITDLELDPERPVAGEKVNIMATITNKGKKIKADDDHILEISFYADYESITTKSIDVKEMDFEHDDERRVFILWTPEAPGIHKISAALDLDSEEKDEESVEVEVIE